MPQINLLPWREELRRRRQKEFGALSVIAVLAMGGVVFAVHLYFQGLIGYQQARNAYLESEIVNLNKKIKQIKDLEAEKERLLARMQIIQELQSSRPEVVHLMDSLVTTLPEGVYYTNVTQKDRLLTLQGIAQSNARVSSLMRRLDGSEWMNNPALVEIKREKPTEGQEVRLSSFNLKINQTDRNAEAAGQANGQSEGGSQ